MVSPTEIQAKVSDSDAAILATAERDIDRALTEGFGNKPEIWIAVKEPWTQWIRAEIMRRYVRAGWNVLYVSDQRDGNSLVFSASSAAHGGDLL